MLGGYIIFKMSIVAMEIDQFKNYKCINKSIIVKQNSIKRNMTYHRDCNLINTTGVISGAEIAYPSGTPEFTPGF